MKTLQGWRHKWMLAAVIAGVGVSTAAQQPAGHIQDITATDGKHFPERERVPSVSVLSAIRRQWEDGFVPMPLAFRDEVIVRNRPQLPPVDKVTIRFTDVRRRDVKLADPSHITLMDSESVEAEGNLRAWFFGLIKFRSKYIQAVAKGTQFGLELNGNRGRLFVWEGVVDAGSSDNAATAFPVREKTLTEITATGALTPPRVPRFDEIRDLALFGIDLDPVISARFRDARSRRQLQEDLLRSEFESRTQPAELGPQVRLGNLYLYLGRNQEALAQFHAAEKISRRSADVYNGKGVVFALTRRYAEAEAEFQTALRRDREARIYNNLGALQLFRNDPAAARTSFQQAINLDPGDEAAYNGLSVALAAESRSNRARLAEAREAAETSLQLRDRPLAYHALANVQLAQGETAEATGNYRRATQDETMAAAAFNNLGVAHLKAADPEAAIEDFLQAIRREPRDATAYCNLGMIYRLQPGLRDKIHEQLQRLATAGATRIDGVLPGYMELLRQSMDSDPARFDQMCENFKAKMERLQVP